MLVLFFRNVFFCSQNVKNANFNHFHSLSRIYCTAGLKCPTISYGCMYVSCRTIFNLPKLIKVRECEIFPFALLVFQSKHFCHPCERHSRKRNLSAAAAPSKIYVCICVCFCVIHNIFRISNILFELLMLHNVANKINPKKNKCYNVNVNKKDAGQIDSSEAKAKAGGLLVATDIGRLSCTSD